MFHGVSLSFFGVEVNGVDFGVGTPVLGNQEINPIWGIQPQKRHTQMSLTDRT